MKKGIRTQLKMDRFVSRQGKKQQNKIKKIVRVSKWIKFKNLHLF